jgi:DNA-binding SARP family transcriptional activator/WD40 repeat protein
MRIAVLGPLEVLTDELAPIVVPGAKERLLLAVLARDAPGVVSTDRLTEALWNGDPPASAHKSLQAHLVRLRSSLEPGRPRGSTGRYVVRRGQGYALAVGREDIDALHLGDLASRGRAQLATGDPAEAERLLSAAVELWRGEPYADWPDAPFAETERRRLGELRTGALAGLLEARLQLGRLADALPELEALVTADPLREDWWRLLMLALYRAGRQADALAAGRRARALLADELGAEPGPALRAMEAAVLAQDPALDLPQPPSREPAPPPRDAMPPVVGERCPYMGLAAYQVADAPLFHGRRRLVSALVGRLVDAPIVVVSGPSGAGKSSVVRAGLVPTLAGGALADSRSWQVLVVTPGRAPVDALAPLTGTDPPTVPFLLVCDQMEELWAPGVDPAERDAFLDTVLGLMDDGVVVRCLAVVRGDFAGRLAEHAAFAERIAGAFVLVPPLTDPELREIVREPAGAVGLTVEPELLDAVVADVLGRPGALPLLSTALVGTWERRRGDALTLAGYLGAGGVSGALTRSAETAFAALGQEDQEYARRLLVRLADVDEGGALVRRRLPLDELDLDDAAASPWRRVVEAFVGRRLLSVDGDHLEVTHEALLTGWPRLTRWLQDDAVGRAVRRHLVPAAHDWESRGRPREELYRGARLAAALDWAAGDDAVPTPLEQEFIAASQEQADTELRQAHEQVARERRARRRTRRLATGLAAVLVVALVAAVLAVRYQQAADTRATELERTTLIADANRLAALSGEAPALDLSLLLAAQAARLADTPQTEDALLGSLLGHSRAVASVTVGEELEDSALSGDGTLFLKGNESVFTWPVGSVAERHVVRPQQLLDWPGQGWIVCDTSPSDDRLVAAGVTVGGGRAVHLWVRLVTADGDTGYLVPPGETEGVPVGIAFTGDGRQVNVLVVMEVAQGTGREPVTWRVIRVDVADGTHRDTGISGTLPGTEELSSDIADNGRTAVVYDAATASATATLVDLLDGRQVSLQVPSRAVDSTGFRALATGAAQLWADGAVTLYDADGRPVQQVDHRPGPVHDIVAAPDGSWVATAGGGGAVTLWDVDAATARWIATESFAGHAGDILEAEITADGRLLATRGEDSRMVLWDVTRAAGFGASVAAAGDRWFAGPPEIVEPDSLVVVPSRPVGGGVGGSDDLAATFLEPGTARVVEQVAVGTIEDPDLLRPSMAVSPDRRMVAISTGLSTTVLDTSTRERLATIDLPPDGDLGSDGRPLSADVVSCAAWTPDSSHLLLCTEDGADNGFGGQLTVVEPTTGMVERLVALGGIAAEAVGTDRDHRRLALAQLDAGLVTVLDARTLEAEPAVEVIGSATASIGAATDVSFSPDGRRIAITGENRDLFVVDPTARAVSRDRIPVGSALLQVEWLADNRTVALGSSDGTLSLFDTERRQLRAPPVSVANDSRAAHLHLVPGSPGEVVAMSGERLGRRWPVDRKVWLEQACILAGRDLTRTEWTLYLPDHTYRPTCTDLD